MLNKIVNKIVKKKPAEYKSHLSIKKTPYDHLGEQGVRDLANTFYDVMETDPNAKELYDIHPKPLDKIREKFFMYLSGWTGGPDLYVAEHGHPRLRARHLSFPVDQIMRDQWMYCMDKALNQCVENPMVKQHLRNAFAQLATHMINK